MGHGPLSSVSLSVSLAWRQLPAWFDRGGGRSPPRWQRPICGLDGWEGSALGPRRRLREQGVLGQVGVLAPPWAWVTCEAVPARGQQRVRAGDPD